MRILYIAVCLASLPLAACASTLSDPPTRLGQDTHYTKYIDAGGIPVASSSRVSDQALTGAREMITGMLAHRPGLAAALVRSDYRVAIIAVDETLLDLPENADWTKPAYDDPRLTRCELKHYEERVGQLTTREYWDGRARGIGGRRTVGSEEDVLGLASSRYYGETILVHEFAHNVLDAIQMVDPALYARLGAAYEGAIASDLWLDEYATTTIQEYWAEGTQTWFNSNRVMVVNGRRVLNHEDLAAYDPALNAVLAQAYGDNHRLKGDPFYLHPARIPSGPIPENTAEVC